MLFQTALFFGFFAVFFALYVALRRHLFAQNVLIVVGSYVFYAAWDLRFLSILVVGTAVAFVLGNGAHGEKIDRPTLYKGLAFFAAGAGVSLVPGLPDTAEYLALCGLGMVALYFYVLAVNRLDAARRARWCLGGTLVFSLSLLAVFKYLNFFVDSFLALMGRAGLHMDVQLAHIVLPVGISFFTFQLLGYVIDVYRGTMPATRSLVDLAAFKAFFPQLVAGPIERAGNLLRQIAQPRELSVAAFRSGAVLFVWGMYKKVVIADNLAPIADQAFANPSAASAGLLAAGLLAFTFQIYCDFSGYSDMARGLARAMGFELMVNFNLPYISRTPSEFWNRWHISLSSWLRDYLYVPLGGNRKGPRRTYFNLAATMLLGGLWHGASWTFVLWGAFHGAILIVYRMLNVDAWLHASRLTGAAAALRNVAMVAVMFVLTIFGWLLFRAKNMQTLGDYLVGLGTAPSWADAPWRAVFTLLVPLLVVQCMQVYLKRLEVFPLLPRLVQLNVALFALFGILLLSLPGDAAFIYFDF